MARWILLLLPSVLLAQAGFYGPCVQGDSLANTTIGPHGNQVDLRFRASPGGVFEGLRPFIIWSFRKAGYHGGTGGILKVELQADDGSADHLPSGRVLASSVQRLYIVPASDQFFPLITFDRKPALAAGSFYHVVFSNPHPLREENFVSVNAIFSKVADRPMQPTRRDGDWTMLYRNTDHPAWVPRRTPGTAEGFTPILEVYCDGGSQGIGYMELWMGAGKPIAGPARVGEVFTVGGPALRVGAVDVRVRKLDGAGPLYVRLEGEDGRLLAEGSAPGPAPSPSCSLGGCAWLEAALPAPLTLRGGGTYRLVLAAPSGARYEAFPLRKGADKGFTGATVFGDGYAEFNDGAGWKGWEQWGQKNRQDSDLQFYFKLTRD